MPRKTTEKAQKRSKARDRQMEAWNREEAWHRAQTVETQASWTRHELSEVYREYNEAEWEALRASMRGVVGQELPGLVVRDGQAVAVVDGWHRFRMCQELGLVFRFEVADISSKAKRARVEARVEALNAARRMLTKKEWMVAKIRAGWCQKLSHEAAWRKRQGQQKGVEAMAAGKVNMVAPKKANNSVDRQISEAAKGDGLKVTRVEGAALKVAEDRFHAGEEKTDAEASRIIDEELARAEAERKASKKAERERAKARREAEALAKHQAALAKHDASLAAPDDADAIEEAECILAQLVGFDDAPTSLGHLARGVIHQADELAGAEQQISELKAEVEALRKRLQPRDLIARKAKAANDQAGAESAVLASVQKQNRDLDRIAHAMKAERDVALDGLEKAQAKVAELAAENEKMAAEELDQFKELEKCRAANRSAAAEVHQLAEELAAFKAGSGPEPKPRKRAKRKATRKPHQAVELFA